jgi:hypothetical protein
MKIHPVLALLRVIAPAVASAQISVEVIKGSAAQAVGDVVGKATGSRYWPDEALNRR